MFFRAVATWYVMTEENRFYEELTDSEMTRFQQFSHWLATTKALKELGSGSAQWWPDEPLNTLLLPCANDESFYHEHLWPLVVASADSL